MKSSGVVARSDYAAGAAKRWWSQLEGASLLSPVESNARTPVRNGMNALGENISFVAVHDAARPLVVPEQIEAVYMAAREYGAASMAAGAGRHVKRADSGSLRGGFD